jgi:hypothetical protein
MYIFDIRNKKKLEMDFNQNYDLLAHGHEFRSLGISKTGSTVSNRSVRDGELSQIIANHVDLYLNQVENLAVVNAHLGTNHLGGDEHIAEVGLDSLNLAFDGGC